MTSGFQFGECRLSQMDSVFPYDLEYGGGRARLVMTPLTERAHIGLTRALRSFESAALVAPTGSGKSALVTDLALVSAKRINTHHRKLKFFYTEKYIFTKSNSSFSDEWRAASDGAPPGGGDLQRSLPVYLLRNFLHVLCKAKKNSTNFVFN